MRACPAKKRPIGHAGPMDQGNGGESAKLVVISRSGLALNRAG
jgi:hypothetical protein